VRTLILARHALAVSNRDGLASCSPPGGGLTSEGVLQARALGDMLADEAIDLGVATELLRTQETLAYALSGRATRTLVASELNEIDFGRYDGGLLADYREWAWREGPELAAPGDGESRSEGARRWAGGLRLLVSRPEETILVVGHALMIRYVVDAVVGRVPAARMAPVPHAQPERLSHEDVDRAANLLESWSRSARFRDPPIEG
jgi:broad specificity phosphatase PhoE